MATPNEIKTGLECCISDTYGCNEKCPYFTSLSNGVDCAVKMHADALALIQQLEAANDELLTNVKQLEAKCHQLEQERDALRQAFCSYVPSEYRCDCCKYSHLNNPSLTVCPYYVAGQCDGNSKWQWRGVKEE